MSARNRKRALLDLKDLKTWCKEIGLVYEEDQDPDCSFQSVFVTILGPEETPYAGGMFKLCCQLPASYPLDSPSIVFKTKIWHPNVEKESGSICLDVLGKRWTPVIRLRDVFEVYIPQLLQCPNDADPFNTPAAAMMKDNATEYADFVRLHTAKYALSQAVQLPDITGAYDFVYESDE
jgi:ubiquitin-conjugating enzyme E2 H